MQGAGAAWPLEGGDSFVGATYGKSSLLCFCAFFLVITGNSVCAALCATKRIGLLICQHVSLVISVRNCARSTTHWTVHLPFTCSNRYGSTATLSDPVTMADQQGRDAEDVWQPDDPSVYGSWQEAMLSAKYNAEQDGTPRRLTVNIRDCRRGNYIALEAQCPRCDRWKEDEIVNWSASNCTFIRNRRTARMPTAVITFMCRKCEGQADLIPHDIPVLPGEDAATGNVARQQESALTSAAAEELDESPPEAKRNRGSRTKPAAQDKSSRTLHPCVLDGGQVQGEPNPYQQRHVPEMYLPRLINTGGNGSTQGMPQRISAEEAAKMQGLERIKDYIADVQPRRTPPGKIVAMDLGSNNVVEAITPTGETILTAARQVAAPAQDRVYLLDEPTEEPTWIHDEGVNSAAMLGAFLGYMSKRGHKVLDKLTFLPLVIHQHRDRTPIGDMPRLGDTSIAVLKPVKCPDSDCERCRLGVGGYRFRWCCNAWFPAYCRMMERDFGRGSGKGGDWHLKILRPSEEEDMC